jgi:hydrogenase maturation protease
VSKSKRTLILGAGNLLLSDEGFGVHFIRHLQANCQIPENVDLLDAGTLGVLVAHRLEDAERVYIIDTIDIDAPPGTCRRYTKEEFVLGRMPVKLSPHQAGVQEMLLISELRGRCPADVFLWGIVPGSLAPGTALSPELAARLPRLAQELLLELGH